MNDDEEAVAIESEEEEAEVEPRMDEANEQHCFAAGTVAKLRAGQGEPHELFEELCRVCKYPWDLFLEHCIHDAAVLVIPTPGTTEPRLLNIIAQLQGLNIAYSAELITHLLEQLNLHMDHHEINRGIVFTLLAALREKERAVCAILRNIRMVNLFVHVAEVFLAQLEARGVGMGAQHPNSAVLYVLAELIPHVRGDPAANWDLAPLAMRYLALPNAVQSHVLNICRLVVVLAECPYTRDALIDGNAIGNLAAFGRKLPRTTEDIMIFTLKDLLKKLPESQVTSRDDVLALAFWYLYNDRFQAVQRAQSLVAMLFDR